MFGGFKENSASRTGPDVRSINSLQKQVAFALASTLWLAGCYPAFRTVQPKVKLMVVDPSGRPVEGATFILATYHSRAPVTTFAGYETDVAGAVSIPFRGDWRMEALLPDGSSWYVWRYCVEKPGYRAIASEQTRRIKVPLTVVLEPHHGSSQCSRPAEGERYFELEVIEKE